jgi:NADH-quinone oxidoreductase subunit J
MKAILDTITVANILVFIVQLWAVLSAAFAISARSPVHAVIALVQVFICIALQLFCLQLHYLALVISLVYLGAILVLFLFIVMVLNTNETFLDRPRLSWFPLMILASAVMFFSILYSIAFWRTAAVAFDSTVNYWATLQANFSHIQLLGDVLFAEYSLPLILVCMILLLSLVGVILLASYSIGSGWLRSQYIYKQTSRKPSVNAFERNSTKITLKNE